jgi:hypothetical protein
MALKSTEVLPLDYVTSTAEFKRSIYHVVIPRKFNWQSVLSPEFWRNVTSLKAHDLIELEHEDGLFDCTVRVVNADRGYAVLRVLSEWHSKPEELRGEAASIGFILGKGWCLFGTDSEPIATFMTEEEAGNALAEYLSNKEQAAA